MLTGKAAGVLAEYAAREEQERRDLAQHDNAWYLAERENMLLGIGPEAGQFLNQLIRICRPQSIVEVGTAFGYSTLWLAEAAAAVGGTVFTFDAAPAKHEHARSMLAKAGLDHSVRFVTGDAMIELERWQGTADFVLIDLWKDLYVQAFDLLLPKLGKNAVVCADNMLFPEYQREAALAYISHVTTTAGMSSITIPVGSGIEFSLSGAATANCAG